jgi:hypothetical protein
MDPTDIVLLFIAIGIVAIVPIGCVMTRKQGKPGVPTAVH